MGIEALSLETPPHLLARQRPESGGESSPAWSESSAYWRRTLRPIQGGASMITIPAVVPAVVADNPTPDTRIEVHLPNGLQVTLSTGLETPRLEPTIRASWSY